MQKHVPFFILAFLFSFSTFAANEAPRSWQDFAGSGTINCADPAPGMETTRCESARHAFCGRNGNEQCTLSRPNTSGTTKADLQRELANAARLCGETQKNAQTNCSGQQGSKASPAAAETMQAACKQLDDAAGSAEKVNTTVGGFCQGVKGRCQSNCNAAKEALTEMAKTCTDCSGFNLAGQSEFKEMTKASQFCEKLNPDQVLQQARTQLNAGNIAEQCKKLSGSAGAVGSGSSAPNGGSGSGGKQADGGKDSGSDSAKKEGKSGKSSGSSSAMNPAMLMGLAQMAMGMMNQPQTPTAQPQAVNPALDKVDCTVNPNLAGCATAAATSDSWNGKSTAAVADANTAAAGGGFNPADDSAMAPASADGNGEPKAVGAPPTVGGVPNGGGGMPGGGGGGAASLGGGAGGGGGAAGASKTDVLHGMSSGGGGMGAMAAGMNMKNGESGGGYTYGQGGGYGGGGDEAGLDLSQFLPGGKQDPTRKIAGIASGGSGNFQIQSKDVNIFTRISERIKARCSQGLLRDCIP